jgi:hypothetical protein
MSREALSRRRKEKAGKSCRRAKVDSVSSESFQRSLVLVAGVDDSVVIEGNALSSPIRERHQKDLHQLQ